MTEPAMTLRITLPWPSRKLHPNARVHWAQRSKAAKSARGYAWALACGVGALTFQAAPGRIPVALTFHPPDKRRRDLDGMLSALKSSLDGVADALRVDDHRFDLSLAISDPVKDGAVVVSVNALPLTPAPAPNNTAVPF